MPIYEFKCQECHRVFDLLVFSGDDVEMACPDCGSVEISKLISAASHTVGRSGGRSQGQGGVTTRTCGSGACGTIDIPGPKR